MRQGFSEVVKDMSLLSWVHQLPYMVAMGVVEAGDYPDGLCWRGKAPTSGARLGERKAVPTMSPDPEVLGMFRNTIAL